MSSKQSGSQNPLNRLTRRRNKYRQGAADPKGEKEEVPIKTKHEEFFTDVKAKDYNVGLVTPTPYGEDDSMAELIQDTTPGRESKLE